MAWVRTLFVSLKKAMKNTGKGKVVRVEQLQQDQDVEAERKAGGETARIYKHIIFLLSAFALGLSIL